MPARTGRPWTRVRARVIRRDGGVCHLCGQPGADTADHLTPVAHGGALYDMRNLAAAHVECNRIRGARPVDVARAELTAPPTTTPATGWTW